MSAVDSQRDDATPVAPVRAGWRRWIAGGLFLVTGAGLVVEQCLKPVDEEEGSYPPDHPESLKQGRRANAGREGTTLSLIHI